MSTSRHCCPCSPSSGSPNPRRSPRPWCSSPPMRVRTTPARSSHRPPAPTSPVNTPSSITSSNLKAATDMSTSTHKTGSAAAINAINAAAANGGLSDTLTDAPTAPVSFGRCPVAHGFDAMGDAYYMDPAAHFAEFRDETPTFFYPYLNAWMVTRHEDALQV